jgi:hypothetical protein
MGRDPGHGPRPHPHARSLRLYRGVAAPRRRRAAVAVGADVRDLGGAETSMRMHLETVQRNLTARLRAVEEPRNGPTAAIT